MADFQFTDLDTNPAGSGQMAGSFYEADPMYHALFENGKIIPKGGKYYRPEYARTLQLIADGGADAFYTGEIAEATVRVVQERGGLLTLADLESRSYLRIERVDRQTTRPLG